MFRGNDSNCGVKAAPIRSSDDGLIPSSGVRALIGASLLLSLLGCGQLNQTFDVRGYQNLSTLTETSQSEFDPNSALEFYFYINSDNDIFGSSESGEVENQGELLAQSLRKLALSLNQRAETKNIGIHYYLDRGLKLRDSDTEASEIYRYCSSEGNEAVTSLGETDSRDPKYIQDLLRVSCVQGSKKVVVLWGHGKGYRAQSDVDYKLPAGTSAESKTFHIETLLNAIPPTFAEAVFFDSCSMASIEISSLLIGKSRFMMASQFVMPNEGLQYDDLSMLLGQTRDVESLMRSIREKSEAKFREMRMSAPLVIVDLTKIQTVLDSFHSVWESTRANRNSNYSTLRRKVRRGDDGDLLFLAQYGFKEPGVEPKESGEILLKKLRESLESGRGSLSFGLSDTLSKDAEFEKIFLDHSKLFTRLSEKLPNWAEYARNRSIQPQGESQ